jgi:hypothetical protein
MFGKISAPTAVFQAITIVSETSRSCRTEMKKEMSHACNDTREFKTALSVQKTHAPNVKLSTQK